MVVYETLYAALDGLACAAVIVCNDTICFANSAALSLFGVNSPDELLSLSPFDLIQPDFHAALQGWPAETPYLAPVEVKLNAQSDSSVWVQFSAQPFSLEGELASLVTAIDITRQKQAESRAFSLQQVIDATPDPLYAKDVDLCFTVVNHAAVHCAGLDNAAQMLGTHAAEMYGATFPLVYDMEKRVMQTGDALVDHEVLIPLQDGSGREVWHSVTKLPLYDAENRIVGLIGVHRDIDEQRKLQAALLVEQDYRADFEIEKAKELDAFKTQIMRRMGHEFRTPLTVISTAGYLLENHNQRLTEERRDYYFRQIEASIRHITAMLDELALAIHGSVNDLLFEPVPINVIDLINEVIDEARLRGDTERQIVFTVEGDSTGVIGDAKHLRRIVAHLLDNALRYSAPTKPVHVGLRLEGRGVTLQVRDEGIGIPAQDLPHIFQPLYRGSNINEVFGLGVGLSITKDAVELHGGTISVESAPGVGSTFTVRLPTN